MAQFAFIRVLCLSAGLLSIAAGQAGETTYISKDASHCEIFAALSNTLPPECAKEKVIVLHESAPTAVSSPRPAVGVQPHRQRQTMAAPIRFAFDSAELTLQSRQQLVRIAKVLSDPIMRGVVVEIEGHTDTKGSADYNQKLSERRASAVRNWLVDQHRIPFALLPAKGLGESRPYDPVNGTAAVNRRVEFINSGVIR